MAKHLPTAYLGLHSRFLALLSHLVGYAFSHQMSDFSKNRHLYVKLRYGRGYSVQLSSELHGVFPT
jgi:hypothetical protein